MKQAKARGRGLMDRLKFTFWVPVLLVMTLFLGLANAQTDEEEEEPPVRLGQINVSFYAVTGQVVQLVLERLDHEVERSTGSHRVIFPQLGQGSIDLSKPPSCSKTTRRTCCSSTSSRLKPFLQ